VVSKPPFNKTDVFLFLNKKDIFEEMLRKVPLSKCFPDYTGGEDVHAALKHVEDQVRDWIFIILRTVFMALITLMYSFLVE
jgi:ASC-1-like (ASCH) protein